MTLGHILRRHGAAFLERYPQTCRHVARTLRSLAACRTEALGGHVTRCGHCGDVAYHYHSCGNRHCPACGGGKRAAFLAKRQAELLPAPYFHLVFTLPHELSALVLGHRRLLYGLLMEASARTLLEVGADPTRLGARLGALMVLHTWGQQLEHHPHVHLLVPGGGLSLDGTRWVASKPNFLLPVKVLGRVFRGKYLEGLRQAHDTGKLTFAGSTAALAERPAFEAFVGELWAKDWVVYAKKPFAGPEVALKYLTRYTHRVALSNGRLKSYSPSPLVGEGRGEGTSSDTHVTLTYKDYADGGATKELTLEAVELVRRFALHVVPKGFVRIRHWGLLAHRGRGERLAKCRALLGVAAPAPVVAAETAKAPLVPPSSSPPPSPARAGTWAACVLAGALVLGLSGTPASSTVVAALAALAASPLPAAPPIVPVCPKCGQSPLETIWRRPRPTGRDLEQRWRWDTS